MFTSGIHFLKRGLKPQVTASCFPKSGCRECAPGSWLVLQHLPKCRLVRGTRWPACAMCAPSGSPPLHPPPGRTAREAGLLALSPVLGRGRNAQVPGDTTHFTLLRGRVLLSRACHNTLLQTGWLQTTEIIFTALDARSPKSRCWQGLAPCEGSRGTSSLASCYLMAVASTP